MAQFATVYAFSDLQFDGLVPCLEGSLHRPDPAMMNGVTGITSHLVDFWGLVTPRPGEEYSVMELPTPGSKPNASYYDEASDEPIRFLAAKIGDSRLPGYNREWVYGWVDDIKVKIQKGQNRSIVVRWHPDWFLTMGTTVSYGAGRILRGPQSLARPDPSEPRMWVDSNVHIELGDGPDHYWLIVLYTKSNTIGSKTYTTYELAFWQNLTAIGTVSSPSLQDVYDGKLEEVMGLDPDTIQGVWASPINPIDTASANTVTNTAGTASWYVGHPSSVMPRNQVIVNSDTYATNDNDKWTLLDSAGNSLGVVPWGIGFDKVKMLTDIGPSGAYLIVSFLDSSKPNKGYGEGRVFSVPLPSISVTQNAMQSYVYSGERDYDKTLRDIQKNQAAVNGIAGAGSSAIGGAVAGTMATGSPAGMAAGAAAGLISATVGTAVSYISAGHFDRKTQEAIDKLKSNQAAGSLVSAGGLGWERDMIGSGQNTMKWSLVKMTRDSVSAAELTVDHDEMGYPTDVYSASCDSMIRQLGPFRIENLETLRVSPAAGRYIAELFARGVHIDANPL